MNLHWFDFRWRQDETQTSGIPEFYCEIQAVQENRFGRRVVQVGDDLSLSVHDGVRCAGAFTDSGWKRCAKLSTGKPKCEYCRAIEGSFVYTAFDGFDQSQLSPEDLQKIRGKHVVYFAYFSPEMIKVGVSKLDRKYLRQVEQGSRATLYIAETPDGIVARQIETLIRKTGLIDKVKSSQKRNQLISDTPTAEIQTQLENLFTEKQTAFAEHPHLQEFLKKSSAAAEASADTAEFRDWKSFCDLGDISSQLHNVVLDSDEAVSGKIIGIKGPFVFLETPNEIISICARDLRGRVVDFSDQPAGLKLNTALQGSMF